jgi:hypothetical protein
MGGPARIPSHAVRELTRKTEIPGVIGQGQFGRKGADVPTLVMSNAELIAKSRVLKRLREKAAGLVDEP